MDSKTEVTFFNDAQQELIERANNEQFERAMNAFWRAYHKIDGVQLWQCIKAAIEAY